MDAHALLSDFRSRGIALIANGEKITVQPASRLTDADRVAIRSLKPDLLRLLSSPEDLGPGFAPLTTPSEDPPWLLVVADAIAKEPRSPFLNDVVLARAAQALVAAIRISTELSDSARANANRVCDEVFRRAAAAIVTRDYQRAYELFDALPGRLRRLRPN
jgi:hypothetical protein